MYVHPAFRTDRAASLAFAAARGFGLVIACDGGHPVASPLPFRLDATDDGTPRLEFHVARTNPLADLASCGGTWLVCVLGSDAYVSPDWYASPDQVPTWLYESVQLGGPVRVMTADAQRGHLARLTEQFEDWLAPKPQWSVGKVTPGRREALMKAIVGIEMLVETVQGSFKLNQHKSDADHVAVAGMLGRQGGGAHTIADRMVALRPHLTYEPNPSPERGGRPEGPGGAVATAVAGAQ